MPRPVVPIRWRPSQRSVSLSSSLCQGMIRCALAEMSSLPVAMPWASRAASSASRVPGSTTMPLPITGVTWGYRMPLGTRWSLKVRPSTITVCPALLPPW